MAIDPASPAIQAASPPIDLASMAVDPVSFLRAADGMDPLVVAIAAAAILVALWLKGQTVERILLEGILADQNIAGKTLALIPAMIAVYAPGQSGLDLALSYACGSFVVVVVLLFLFLQSQERLDDA